MHNEVHLMSDVAPWELIPMGFFYFVLKGDY